MFKNMFKKAPSKGHESSVWLAKDKTGQLWFFGIYSNKFEDREKEILSEEAHLDYVAWRKRTGFKPVVTAYHYPRMPYGFWAKTFDLYESNIPVLQLIVDHVYRMFGFASVEQAAYVNGFTLIAAKVWKGKEAVAERLAAMQNVGMSHGFLSKDSSDNIYNSYRSFEMSVLKRTHAANFFTLSRILRQKGKPMGEGDKGINDPEAREFLVQMFDEETVALFEEETESGSKILSGLLAFKDKILGKKEEAKADMPMDMDEEDEEDEDKEEKQDAKGLTVESLANGLTKTFTDLQAVLAEMQKELVESRKQNAEQAKQIEALTEKVSELKKTEDDRVAQLYLPVWNFRAQGYSASKADDNVIVDDEEKKEISKTAPEGDKAKVDADNVLNLGFWNALSGQ